MSCLIQIGKYKNEISKKPKKVISLKYLPPVLYNDSPMVENLIEYLRGKLSEYKYGLLEYLR